MNTKPVFPADSHNLQPTDDKNSYLTDAQIGTLAAVNELGGWNTSRGICAAGGANACLSALVREGLLSELATAPRRVRIPSAICPRGATYCGNPAGCYSAPAWFERPLSGR